MSDEEAAVPGTAVPGTEVLVLRQRVAQLEAEIQKGRHLTIQWRGMLLAIVRAVEHRLLELDRISHGVLERKKTTAVPGAEEAPE